MIDTTELERDFRARFARGARIFRAPGRVNLIGEHTDYNEGFVMPCAIDFATYVAIAPRDDNRFVVASTSFDDTVEFDVESAQEFRKSASWARYVAGVAYFLGREGVGLRGADILIASDVPVGAGLSSSAALEIACGTALNAISGGNVDKVRIALIGQRTEHEFAGVRSGIMDQFASSFGVAGHAMFLDCRTLDRQTVPLDGARFIIANTNTRHDLADGEYNKRRQDCEEAARYLGVRALRDATPEMVEELVTPERPRRRARHITTENLRVLAAVDALATNNLTHFGELMNASHESLRNDFQVSSHELDLMVGILRRSPSVLGARMTGGGFGGCAIALVEGDVTDELLETIETDYRAASGIKPEIYLCRPSNGAAEI